MTWLLVALGGAAGALARYGVARALPWGAGEGFPWATFGVNVAGALLLGVLLRWLPGDADGARALLAVGFCGAFTTFSTFGWETLVMVERQAWGLAAAYVGGSVVAGVAAVAAGLWVGGRMGG